MLIKSGSSPFQDVDADINTDLLSEHGFSFHFYCASTTVHRLLGTKSSLFPTIHKVENIGI